AGGAAVGGQRVAAAVRSGRLGATQVPQARRLSGARSTRRGGRLTMTPVSSDLAIGATRASCEADFGDAPIGRDATGLFNTNRDRTLANDKPAFIRSNLLDLVAILPWDVLRGLR